VADPGGRAVRRSGDFGQGGLDVIGGGELGAGEGRGEQRVVGE
jgi:hypothetical protein